MRPTFETNRDYFQFVFAREFRYKGDLSLYPEEPRLLQRLGGALSAPILGISNFLLQNLNNPLLIIAVTIVAIAAVSICFYPAATVAFIGFIAPPLLKITPAMIKFALFTVVELTILGLGIRAIGRMNQPKLVELWNQRQLVAIQIGAIGR